MHRLGHTLGFLQRGGQRLLTPNHLSGLGGGECDGRVQNVRHGDIDNINVGPGDYSLPVSRSFFPSPQRRRRFELGLIAPADNFQPKFVRNIKEMPDLPEGVGMRLGDETRSDHGDIQLLFRHGLPAAGNAHFRTQCTVPPANLSS